MKKVLVLLVAALMLVLGACSESDVKTGGTPNSTEKKATTETKSAPKEDNSKKVDASKQVVNVLGMQVGLGEIKIEEDKISVGINIKNTTAKKLTFYPDQGHLVVGDMQLDANFIMTEGKIGGDVEPSVKQDAVLVFPAPDGKKIDVKTVAQLKLIFGDVVTDDYMNNKPVEFTVPVK